MKWLALVAALVIAWLAARWLIAQFSPQPDALAGPDQALSTCPGSPNCVSSTDQPPSFGALEGANASEAFAKLTARVQADRHATIIRQTDHYLHAEYRSAAFGFIDDLELRLSDERRVDLRSASRLGYSDFGVNKKRLSSLTDGITATSDEQDK